MRSVEMDAALAKEMRELAPREITLDTIAREALKHYRTVLGWEQIRGTFTKEDWFDEDPAAQC